MKDVLNKKITSSRQDQLISVVVVAVLAGFVAYAIHYATQSTVAAIDAQIETATIVQSF